MRLKERFRRRRRRRKGGRDGRCEGADRKRRSRVDRAFAWPESGRRAREEEEGERKKKIGRYDLETPQEGGFFSGGDDDGGGEDLERKGGRRGCARAHLLDVHDAIAVFEVVRWNIALDQLLDVLQALLRRDDGEGWLGVSGARDVGGGAREGAQRRRARRIWARTLRRVSSSDGPPAAGILNGPPPLNIPGS